MGTTTQPTSAAAHCRSVLPLPREPGRVPTPSLAHPSAPTRNRPGRAGAINHETHSGPPPARMGVRAAGWPPPATTPPGRRRSRPAGRLPPEGRQAASNGIAPGVAGQQPGRDPAPRAPTLARSAAASTCAHVDVGKDVEPAVSPSAPQGSPLSLGRARHPNAARWHGRPRGTSPEMCPDVAATPLGGSPGESRPERAPIARDGGPAYAQRSL